MSSYFIISYILFLVVCAVFGLQVAEMLKRWSTSLKKNKSNGEVKQNGAAESAGRDAHKLSAKPQKIENENQDHSENRKEVESTFEQYAHLIHTARRPLPIQSGDGSYLEHDVPSGLMDDLKALGFKDVGTLINVMKTKAYGGLIDDKAYLMERTIQVWLRRRRVH